MYVQQPVIYYQQSAHTKWASGQKVQAKKRPNTLYKSNMTDVSAISADYSDGCSGSRAKRIRMARDDDLLVADRLPSRKHGADER